MHRAYVALGANLADPVAQVCAAFDALRSLPETRLLQASSLYRTAPVGVCGQPDFINAVARLETGLDAAALLDALLAIEATFGRRRDFDLAPRTLDLDILLWGADGAGCIDTATLTVPHPRLHGRAFVLRPLADIAPALVSPAALQAVADQRIERLE